MLIQRLIYTFVLVLLVTPGLAQQKGAGAGAWYLNYERRYPDEPTNFAVTGQAERIQSIENVHYKYQAGNWHHIRCTPSVLSALLENGIVQQVYFAPSYPQTLCDTMRIVQNIDSVHSGFAPLISPFTGKDVIVGYIDTGIDFLHEDFQNADGSTRVLYYWDHTLPFDPSLTPGKYGYGQLWDSTHINNGTCLSSDGNAHGTTVSGAGSGNGLANGYHKGVAPECDLIIVETNFSLANWTLSIADAVDFIFSMADTLGKPCVINASVGDYLGSHDGTDPAAEVIDSLLDDMPGRIMVSAAGNSGAQGKYHVKGVVDADTSFCWFEVNPSSAFGVPAVYFDFWADTADFNNVQFAMGADNTSPLYEFRGRTQFYNIQDVLGVTTYDSIMAGPNKLSPVEFSASVVNGVYHIEMLLSNPDSSTYLFRFETVGSGDYDLWSGAWAGLSNIKHTAMPTVGAFPPVAHYHYPDTLSTIVSSWTCSPKVVTVGNFKNQYDYIDVNGNPFVLSGGPAGQLSANSSKGPNRLGVTKPDIAATGDGILASCPLWLQSSLIVSNPPMLSLGGEHVRNGGTSMASPIIAGIAALYLEKCPNATYQDFLNDLHAYGYEDGFTGVTPNNAYGYGKIDAFELLNSTNFGVTLTGDTLICDTPELFETVENNFVSYQWPTGETTPSIILDATDTIFVIVSDAQGCKAISDSIVVIKGTLPTYPVINIIGGGLITTTADSLIWYFEGDPIPNSNSQYYNPDSTGNFSVEVFSAEGCSYLSDPVFVDLSQLDELTQNEFIIFPNPFVNDMFLIKNEFRDVSLVITDISGKIVYQYSEINSDTLFLTLPLNELAAGSYFLSLYYENNFSSFKLVKAQ
jgi:hypothetical protein